MKHTPGPWQWGSPHGALEGQFGQVICWSASERGEQWEAINPEIKHANQRLLRAAPELAEALRLAVQAHDEIVNSDLPALLKASFAARFNAEQARALLARLEGKGEA